MVTTGPTNQVIIARYLTTDTVAMARTAVADIIVTGPASSCCHGANVLRYLAANGAPISWRVTESSELLPSTARATWGRVEHDGAHESLVCRETGIGDWQRIPTHDPSVGRPENGDHLAFVLGSGRVRVVAMAARRYDVLTASLMMHGLADCATWLCGEPVRLGRAASGHLVLDTDRLTHASLVTLASDLMRSRPYLERQISVYRDLHRQWRAHRERSCVSVADLRQATSMLTSFFSVLILLHTSYSDVMERCLVGQNAVRIAALPTVLRWQIDEVGLFPAKKDALEPGPQLPEPGFTIDDDLRDTRHRVLSAAPGPPCGELAHLALVSVLKEWKFFLAKALHRHFSVTLRRLSGLDEQTAVPDDHAVRALPVEDLLTKLEEGQPCGPA